MTSSNEITIPKSRTEVTFQFLITLIVVVFVAIAILDIILGVALVVSVVWLVLITMLIWSKNRQQGNLYRFLMNYLGNMFGRHFAEMPAQNSSHNEVHFGYELFGRRFLKQIIRIDRIESVEWYTGQATDMAGRDMNDWNVCLWYNHNDPVKSEKNSKWHRKPDQDVYIVGPSVNKEKVEALGTLLIAFLRDAGISLVQSEESNCFVRNDKKQ
ncbi:MAG: hypothetical protein JXA96_06030 [Sedimentisphaerales bacterium]|nr:hypothetical protein [Sedimentisphaerales bacterium]